MLTFKLLSKGPDFYVIIVFSITRKSQWVCLFANKKSLMGRSP